MKLESSFWFQLLLIAFDIIIFTLCLTCISNRPIDFLVVGFFLIALSKGYMLSQTVEKMRKEK